MTGGPARGAAAAGVALASAAMFAAAGLAYGTWAVGGSDSSCYALMADAFARGDLQPSSPLAIEAPWPEAALTLAPGGFIPSPVRSDAASPICAPGFAVFLAPLRWLAGRDGIFLGTPLAGALLVWWAFVVGRGLAGGAAGAAGAALVAASPIALFQVVQPMNDIAAGALWMGVLAAATRAEPGRSWLMGALAGAAVLVRPNLAPLALAAAAWLVWQSPRDTRLRGAGRFAAGAAPGMGTALVLNTVLYGHPLRLGYGAPTDLFALAYVPENVLRYGRAAIETQTVFPLLALVALLALPREKRPVVWLAWGGIAATLAVYLPYRPFDEWWYLRFLIPALTSALVLASAVVAAWLRRPLLVAALATALAAHGLWTAIDRQAFELRALESRFRVAAHAVEARLPPDAVLVTVWHSGTVRYQAGRDAVLWDSLDPAWLDRAIAWLETQGREAFILVERWEEPRFRERFAGASTFGALDWPPRLDVARRVRVFATRDRARYVAGEFVPTEYVW